MKLRLMTDYDCYPIWERTPGGLRNVAPESLPIPADLAKAIEAWADRYDNILNREDPASTAFASEDDERDFEETGLRLWIALREALGDRAEVTYYSHKERRDLTP